MDLTESPVKSCTGCGVEKPLGDFYADSRTTDGRCTRCKKCHTARHGSWKRANRQKVAGYNRKWYEQRGRGAKYGLSVEEYAALVAEHGDRCAICGESETATGTSGAVRSLAVDHDHVSGVVRGLLCDRCNKGLGFFRDAPERLRAAADYIERVNVK